MSDRPLLGIVARPGEGEVLRPLLRALSARVEIRAVRQGTGEPHAVLATSPLALGTVPEWRGPTAVWIGDEDQLEAFRDLPASVPHTVITTLHEAASAATAGGAQALVVGRLTDADRRERWVPPLVRARWREREDLPQDLVVVIGEATRDCAPDDDSAVRHVTPDDPGLAHLLRVAAACVVGHDRLALALASGCPTVTAADAAAALGVADQVEVVVCDDLADAVRRATELTGSPEAATRLSYAAHTAIARSSAASAADSLVALLGLDPHSNEPWQRAIARLEAIELPTGTPLRRRVVDALQPLARAGASQT